MGGEVEVKETKDFNFIIIVHCIFFLKNETMTLPVWNHIASL
jgi:hypothetical protein